MMKKKYFPTQETPDRVKGSVMSQINKGGKTFRLIYIMKHKSITTVLMLVLVIIGSYIYLNNMNDSSNNENIFYKVNMAEISDIYSNVDNNDVLKKKITETESELNNLYDKINKESDITF